VATILQSPPGLLYKVERGKKSHYCYNEQDLKKRSVSRFGDANFQAYTHHSSTTRLR